MLCRSLFYQLPFFSNTENNEVVQDNQRYIDHVAVVSTNFLFFVILFIFAVFET